MISLLADNAELGIAIRGREVRRILLPQTEHFLYYRVRPRAGRVEVLAIWHSGRQFEPLLPR